MKFLLAGCVTANPDAAGVVMQAQAGPSCSSCRFRLGCGVLIAALRTLAPDISARTADKKAQSADIVTERLSRENMHVYRDYVGERDVRATTEIVVSPFDNLRIERHRLLE